MLDVKSQTELAVLHATANVTTAQSVSGTEIAEFHGSCFVVDVGTHNADGLTVTFQHRDGTDSWENIPASDLDGNNDIAITSSEADSQIYVGYTGNKENVGALIAQGGSGDANVGVYAVKGDPSQFPTN